jgi:hypothetical protein
VCVASYQCWAVIELIPAHLRGCVQACHNPGPWRTAFGTVWLPKQASWFSVTPNLSIARLRRRLLIATTLRSRESLDATPLRLCLADEVLTQHFISAMGQVQSSTASAGRGRDKLNLFSCCLVRSCLGWFVRSCMCTCLYEWHWRSGVVHGMRLCTCPPRQTLLPPCL